MSGKLHRNTRSCLRILAVASLSAAAVGCTSCGSGPRADGGTDADVGGHDADHESEDADGGDVDAPTDADIPDGCEALDVVEVPRTRDGLDCGEGCRQLTFAAPIRAQHYSIGATHLAYLGGALDHEGLYWVELSSGREARFEDIPIPGPAYTSWPGVFENTVVYSRVLSDSDLDWSLWRYRIGDGYRCHLVDRRMTERELPLVNVTVQDHLVAWYDSAIAPSGLYVMPLAGGDVVSLTSNECVCYGPPRLAGREVVYESWAGRPSFVRHVNVDTLEERALTSVPSQQWNPAFDGRWAVWTDGRNDPSSNPGSYLINPDIYGMPTPDGAERAFCTHPAAQVEPAVNGGLVAWVDYRNAEDPNDGNERDANTDIYLFDLETGEEHQVTSLPGPEREPELWGRRLYYTAPDALGQVAVFEVDLDVRLGSP